MFQLEKCQQEYFKSLRVAMWFAHMKAAQFLQHWTLQYNDSKIYFQGRGRETTQIRCEKFLQKRS